jgi:hypothetical protein
MEKREVVKCIEKAREGIQQYLEIMELFPHANVAGDSSFQRKFNRFYRVRQRPAEWYEIYYSFMQLAKAQRPTFNLALDHFRSTMGRCEPSFSSKLIATIDPSQPVWDKYVLQNAGIAPPKYTSKNKIEESKNAYRQLQRWYQVFLESEDGQLIIRTFNEIVVEFEKITDLKKVDFVLWQMRA